MQQGHLSHVFGHESDVYLEVPMIAARYARSRAR